jgi:hypothetical protein
MKKNYNPLRDKINSLLAGKDGTDVKFINQKHTL